MDVDVDDHDNGNDNGNDDHDDDYMELSGWADCECSRLPSYYNYREPAVSPDKQPHLKSIAVKKSPHKTKTKELQVSRTGSTSSLSDGQRQQTTSMRRLSESKSLSGLQPLVSTKPLATAATLENWHAPTAVAKVSPALFDWPISSTRAVVVLPVPVSELQPLHGNSYRSQQHHTTGKTVVRQEPRVRAPISCHVVTSAGMAEPSTSQAAAEEYDHLPPLVIVDGVDQEGHDHVAGATATATAMAMAGASKWMQEDRGSPQKAAWRLRKADESHAQSPLRFVPVSEMRKNTTQKITHKTSTHSNKLHVRSYLRGTPSITSTNTAASSSSSSSSSATGSATSPSRRLSDAMHEVRTLSIEFSVFNHALAAPRRRSLSTIAVAGDRSYDDDHQAT